jgi:hypothetical protein
MLKHIVLTNVYVLTFYFHYYNISCVDWKIVNIIGRNVISPSMKPGNVLTILSKYRIIDDLV